MAEKKKGGATKNKVNSGDILRSVMKIRGSSTILVVVEPASMPRYALPA